MSVNSISELSRQHMLSILGYSSTNQSSTSMGSSISSGTGTATSGQLSPFAQMLSELQQLEQANPTQFSQVSQQISTNFSTAAASAQAQGNTTLASQLTTLSKDFATASATASGSGAAATTANATAATTSATHHGLLNFVEKAMSLVGV